MIINLHLSLWGCCCKEFHELKGCTDLRCEERLVRMPVLSCSDGASAASAYLPEHSATEESEFPQETRS